MSEKLSATMRAALAKLTTDGWYMSYNLNVSLATLCALRSRGLVNSRDEPGAMFCPQVGIKWRLTEAGKEVQDDA